MILKNKVLFSIPTAQLSGQIASRRKAREKLPLYFDTPGMIYPPTQNLEQSSSQATALFKSTMLQNLLEREALVGADLTGGFGVDTFFFSKTAKRIHYVEEDASLLEIARHSHQLLGAVNIDYHVSTAEEFLNTTTHSFDFVYLDPSRRLATRRKTYALADSQPDVLKLKAKILERTAVLILKASPVLDIQAGISQLGCVRKAFVISVKNECKEVLYLCERNFSGTPVITAVNLREGDLSDNFEFTFPDEHDQEVTFSDPLEYVYEPNTAILKAGAFKSVAARFNLKKISVNTHLYTEKNLIEGFPGKRFQIEKLVKPEPRVIRDCFPGGKANVTTRNYPLTPEELKKKTGLKDGGDKYLIGFSGKRKKFLVVAARV